MIYEDTPLIKDAHNAIKLAFDYLDKGIWSLFGGPWKDSELIYLLVSLDSESIPERPALDVSEAQKYFTLSVDYSTLLLQSPGYNLTIDAKCLNHRIRWLNEFTIIPKNFCAFVYSDSCFTEEDCDLANDLYETFILAIKCLRQVLEKIHSGKISVKWENNIIPELWSSISVPTPLDFYEIRIKDKMSMLFDRFVDEMDLLAVQIVEIEQRKKQENITRYSNLFTFSEASSHIDEIQGLIEHIRSEIKPDMDISLKEYKDRVKEIDTNTKFVRLANAYVVSDGTQSEANATHNKKVGELITAYRTLLFEFNSCIIRYNQLNINNELKPLASVDVSPLHAK